MKLEIFIITYNRAMELDKTLDCLSSRLKDYKLTILDNCSTDTTQLVVDSWRKLFKNLKHIRHAKNIGADANNLRAVELSTSLYTWIICDDDKILADEMEDVLVEIERGLFDRLTLKFNTTWIKPGSLLYHTFTPACIFRTATFKDIFIQQGYLNNLLPQFHYHLFAETNLICYISKNTIIIKDFSKISYSTLRFMVSWFQCCSDIFPRKLRHKTLMQLPLIKTFIYSYVIDRKYYTDQWKREFCKLAKLADLRFKLLFLALFMLLIIFPSRLIKSKLHFDGKR